MDADKNKTLSVAVLSGKGGVGKTSLALNLGYAMHKAGHPLLLMDCDLGLANLDVMLGLAPDRTLQDLLRPGVRAEDIVVAVEKDGFDFLPSASGVPEMADMDEDVRGVLVRKLNQLFARYDFLVLDLGAGISPTVLAFACMAKERIVVITPEPTSMTDGYALIKVLSTQHGVTRFQIVVNQVLSSDEGLRTFERIQAACERFLNIPVGYLGCIHHDQALPDSVMRQVPLLKRHPRSKAARDITEIASELRRERVDLLTEIEEEPVFSGLDFENDL